MRAVTAGNAYHVATSPTASSSAAATRPPCTIPGPPWWRSSNEKYASYSVRPSSVGCGRCSPIGLSPHPQHCGSWCGGICIPHVLERAEAQLLHVVEPRLVRAAQVLLLVLGEEGVVGLDRLPAVDHEEALRLLDVVQELRAYV